MKGILVALAGVMMMGLAGFLTERVWDGDQPALAQAGAYACLGVGLFGVAVGAIVVGLRLTQR